MKGIGLFVAGALCAFAAPAEGVPSPYGVCSHLAGGEYGTLDETCDMIALTGIGYVRADFNWNHCQKKPGGEWDFSQFDRALRSASVPYGYKFISRNVGVMEGKISLPHYMAMFVRPIA